MMSVGGCDLLLLKPLPSIDDREEKELEVEEGMENPVLGGLSSAAANISADATTRLSEDE
jgi:hypothetical protein